MHPEILRQMAEQHHREMRARAAEARLAGLWRLSLRRPRGSVQADELVIPAIPDFVDGSFLTEPARVPADRHAA